MREPRRARSRLALILAAAACFVAAWSVVPPFFESLIPLSVAATEASAWIILVAIIASALAVPDLRRRRAARTALVVAAIAISCALQPWLHVLGVAREHEALMNDALGAQYLRGVADEAVRRLRPGPLVLSDVVLGLEGGGDTRVERGIPFAAPGREPLLLDVYRPAAEGSFPAIVLVYGGAWQRGAPGDDAGHARYFAARGYVVFTPDYRHAPRWPWPAQIEDLRAALAWISAHGSGYGADTARLAMIGRSSGAQLALIASYEPGATAVRAVVSCYGPVDLALGWREPPRPDPLDVRSIVEALLGGTPEEVPARYLDASPVTYVGSVLPPTLLLYGGRDHVVPARFGALLHERLRANGTTAVLLEIPWAEHAFDAIPNGPGAQLALYDTERFLAWALYRDGN
jgi:acetyl esterase/lipase